MRKPVLGLLVALGAAAAGFFWGRHLRDEAARAVAAPAAQAPAQNPAPQAPEEPSQPLEVPPDLPTDASRGDSVPQSLE